MDTLFPQTLENMEATLRIFEQRVPVPQQVSFADSFVYRYVEQTAHQALVQKLARMVSGLHAAWILIKSGFVQEHAALLRIIGEIQEDITFLSYAIIKNDITALHKEYLEAFYEEEFDDRTAFNSTQKRPMPSRKKIRAYLARIKESGIDSSRAAELSRTLSKAYSGFVHGASPHIMDMYGGNPPRFFVSGMLSTPRVHEHLDDLWNYFYRGIIACGIVAKVFGDRELDKSIKDYLICFEEKSGRSYASKRVDGS